MADLSCMAAWLPEMLSLAALRATLAVFSPSAAITCSTESSSKRFVWWIVCSSRWNRTKNIYTMSKYPIKPTTESEENKGKVSHCQQQLTTVVWLNWLCRYSLGQEVIRCPLYYPFTTSTSIYQGVNRSDNTHCLRWKLINSLLWKDNNQ